MTAYAQLTLLMPDVPAKITSIRRVHEHADPAWLAQAYSAIQHLCAQRFSFTSDDVWALLDARNVPAPREPRALGAVMRQAARDGLLEASGEYVQSERSECHNRPVAIWEVRK
jgi:hypothetical protein